MSSISTCIQNVAVKLKAKTYSYQIGTTIFCDSTWHVEHPEKLHSVLISYVKHIKLPNRRVNQFYINQFYINQWTNFIFYKPILYKPMNQFYILSRIASAFCLYLSIYSQIFFGSVNVLQSAKFRVNNSKARMLSMLRISYLKICLEYTRRGQTCSIYETHNVKSKLQRAAT